MAKLNLPDKPLHVIAAFVILVLVGHVLVGAANHSNLQAAVIGAIVTEIALVAKELWDKFKKRTKFDWADIQWGQIGVIAAFLCVWLLI